MSHGHDASASIVAERYTAHKGDVELAIYRKYAPEAWADGPRGVLVLVHGSSVSARTTYDLEAGGLGE